MRVARMDRHGVGQASVTVHLPVAEAVALDRACAARGCSRKALIREALLLLAASNLPGAGCLRATYESPVPEEGEKS